MRYERKVKSEEGREERKESITKRSMVREQRSEGNMAEIRESGEGRKRAKKTLWEKMRISRASTKGNCKKKEERREARRHKIGKKR